MEMQISMDCLGLNGPDEESAEWLANQEQLDEMREEQERIEQAELDADYDAAVAS